MPRYYFDLTQGSSAFVDDEGEELDGDRQARECAGSVLIENLGKRLSDAGTEMAVTVRDVDGPRFVATLYVRVSGEKFG